MHASDGRTLEQTAPQLDHARLNFRIEEIKFEPVSIPLKFRNTSLDVSSSVMREVRSYDFLVSLSIIVADYSL